MRIHEILEHNELLLNSPLPDDWDADALHRSKSHDSRIGYAQSKKAKQIGKGSSRTVYHQEYQGRDTVLKLAHDDAGISQNAAEAAILANPAVVALGITIPLIDVQTNEHGIFKPTWIQLEQGTPTSEKELCQLMKCGDLVILISIAENLLGRKAALSMKEIYDLLINSYKVGMDGIDVAEDYANKIAELYRMTKLVLRDLTSPHNWAVWNGKPYIIDAGFDEAVQTKHYNRTKS
jgi:hypothetical protein